MTQFSDPVCNLLDPQAAGRTSPDDAFAEHIRIEPRIRGTVPLPELERQAVAS